MTQDPDSPMRVSAWSPSSGPGAGISVEVPRTMSQPTRDAEQAEPAEESGSPGFISIDPYRLLGGAWKRRWWAVAGMVLGLGAGLGWGVMKTFTRYEVTVDLIKLNLPTTFRVGDVGEAYHPQELSSTTLESAASSYNVLQRVVNKTTQPISVALLSNSVEVKDERNSDIIHLTLSGYFSIDATVELANLWAQEVVGFTKDMQVDESRNMHIFLQQQVDAIDADLTKLNEDILDYSKREGIVDSDKEIDADLRSLGDVEVRYETAKIALDTIDYKISSTEEQLRQQSPLSDQLKTAQADLDNLRTRYTDQNPLVEAQLDKIHDLEQQLQKQSGGASGDDSQFAGTFLGNTLYLKLLDLQNDKKGLEHEKEALEKIRSDTQATLAQLPEKSAAMAQMVQKRQALETGRNLLFSRLREAELYENNAPGFFQIFSPAAPERVVVHSKTVKIVIFAIAGCVGGSFAALFLALGLELADATLRRGAELQRLLSVPLLGAMKRNDTDAMRAKTAGEIWSRWIGSQVKSRTPRIIWSPAPSAKESLFWDPMLEEAAGLLAEIQVIDCRSQNQTVALPLSSRVAGDPRIHVEACDITRLSIAQAEALAASWVEASRRGKHLWVRLSGPVGEPAATLARAGEGVLILAALHTEPSGFWRAQADLMRKTIGGILGIVSVDELGWREW